MLEPLIPTRLVGSRSHTANTIVGPVVLCWVWSGQTREGKMLGGSSHGCQGWTAQAASMLQFLGAKKSKHVCIHLYSQGALGNSPYHTAAFPRAGVCCWRAWGQCCSRGVHPRDCRRAAGRPVPHHTAAYPTAPSLPKLPPALIPASQSHGAGTAQPHLAPSSTKSLHTRPGAHPAGTGGSTTRGQAALGHLALVLHGGEQDLFVLPGGLFVLKVHLVSETAFQVAAEGGWALMVQGAPPGMHEHADRTYVTITPPSCSPGHGHTLGAVLA